MSKKFFSLILFVFSLVVSGCQDVYRDPLGHVPVGRCVSEVAVERYVAGKSVQGRAIECVVLGQGGDVTFIMAAIHGDEPAGVGLVDELIEYLRGNPGLMRGRKVVVMPVANPDGLAEKSRFNSNGIDLNRNFATGNRVDNERHGDAGLTEPESKIIAKLIDDYQPGRIVSIHQPLDCVDYDGPAYYLARQMAQFGPLPFEKLNARCGSLGSYAGLELGIPIVTIELTAEDSFAADSVLWRNYGQMLIAAVIYPEQPATCLGK